MTDRRAEPRRLVHEEIIANAMVDVATELRLADPSELILMIRGEQAANIADLVNSSSELFFKSGTLRYALSAGCDVQWDSTPTIRLDMEFRYAAVCAFFRLMIGRKRAAVDVVEVLFDDEDLDGAAKDERLSAAIASARLRPRRGLSTSAGAAAASARRAAVAQAWSKAGRVTSRHDPMDGIRRVSQPYVLQLASQRTQWLSARESLIASNVANANTPGYQAIDLQPFSAVLDSTQVSMVSTNPGAHDADAGRFRRGARRGKRPYGRNLVRQFGQP